MIETGKPFKMNTKTRKAKNALWRSADLLGIHQDEVLWERIANRATGKFPVVALGDSKWDTIRWVQTQDDPDCEIVK